MKSAWFYLAFLTLQNAAVTLTVRTTKLRPFIDETGAVVPYSVGMTVVIGELIKTVVCLFMSIYNNEQQPAGKRGRASPSEIVSALSSSVAENWWRVGVPAVLFSFQNFLNVSGGGRLPPAVTQAMFQMKILTSALFSRLLLGKSQTKGQWLALSGIVTGVVLVTTGTSPAAVPPGAGFDAWDAAFGLAMLATASCFSGLSGAWTEREIKSKARGRDAFWEKSFCLALISIPIGVFNMVTADRDIIFANGVLGGFTRWTWAIITLQTVAGVMTGLVIRYADQVVKNLAAPSAVVITLFVARWLFGDPINVRNLLGVTLIASCTLTYGLSRSRQAAAEAEKAAGEKKKD